MVKVKELFSSFMKMFSGTFISRLLGLFREILSAQFFGASSLYDAFNIAYKVPNLFRRVFGEDMFEQAFFPKFNRLRSEGRHSEAREYILKVFLIVLLLLSIILFFLYSFLDSIISFLAPGFSPENLSNAIYLGRLILPFIFLIALTSYTGAMLLFSGDKKLDAKAKTIYSFGPALWNFFIVVILLIFQNHFGIKVLVFAYLGGALVYLLFQLPMFFKILKRVEKTTKKEEVSKVVKRELKVSFKESFKVFLTSIVNKAVDIVDGMVASLCSVGAISSLYYANRIVQLPFSIFSLSLVRVVAPELSLLRGKKKNKNFDELVNGTISIAAYVLVPITLIFFFLSPYIIKIIYQRGEFGVQDTADTSLAFQYYALSLLPFAIIALLRRVYAALENNKIPLYASLLAGSLNLVLDFILYKTSLKHGGIALATSIAACVNAFILLYYLKEFNVRVSYFRLFKKFIPLLISSSFMIPVLLIWRYVLVDRGIVLSIIISLVFVLLSFLVFFLFSFPFISIKREHKLFKNKILLTGGGTGGHVYPSLAIFEILKKEKIVDKALYLGIKGRAEERIVPKYGIPMHFIKSGAVAGGQSPIFLIKNLSNVFWGTIQSLKEIIRFKPNLVIATGGYVSAPVIFASALLKPFLGMRIIVEEQNIMPGLMNKFAALFADLIFLNYRESNYYVWSNKCVEAGYPLRKEYYKNTLNDDKLKDIKEKYKIPDDSFLILIVGGSLGARSINQLIPKILKHFQNSEDIFILHSIGMNKSKEYNSYLSTIKDLKKKFGKEIDKKHLELKNKKGKVFYKGVEFLENIYEIQQLADLIVSRAGAGALAEISAFSKASIVIPKRGLPGDHQELNAIALAERGAVEIIFEKRNSKGYDVIDENDFINKVNSIKGNPNFIKELQENAGKIFYKNSENIIINSIQKILEHKEINYIENSRTPNFIRFQVQFDSLINYLDGLTSAQKRENFYAKYYENKIDEYLQSSDYLVKNKAIKLIGSLSKTSYYDFLAKEFIYYQGYLRRNILSAFIKQDKYHPAFNDVLSIALKDSYFEVRREAIKLYIKFFSDLSNVKSLGVEILKMLRRKRENFEVKNQAMKACTLFLDSDKDIISVWSRFVNSRTVRLRQGVLDAAEFAVENSLFTDLEMLRLFLKRVMITTSDFRPVFNIKHGYNKVIKKVEEKRNDRINN